MEFGQNIWAIDDRVSNRTNIFYFCEISHFIISSYKHERGREIIKKIPVPYPIICNTVLYFWY